MFDGNKKKPVLQQAFEELRDHFKGCLTRATFLRNQGYLTLDEWKKVRERIFEEQKGALNGLEK